MDKQAKIYLAGHRGLVGSAIKKNLELRGFTNIIHRTHKELNLANQLEVSSFFKKEKPDYVILAAAKVGGIIANNTYRADFIYENLMIQNNVIHQSFVHDVKKLLFLGSTCIYPKAASQPMKEDSLLTSELEYTNEPYAIAKIAGIKMCESYNIQYGTNFIAVQPTNLYGPNDNFDLEKSHVLPALIRKIHLGKALQTNDWKTIINDLNKLPIEDVSGESSKEEIIKKLNDIGVGLVSGEVVVEIWGSGKPMREFLWSEDMADACVHLMENVGFKDVIEKQNGINHAEIINTHINIGTGKEISIRELAETIKNTVGFPGKLVFNSSKPDGTMRKLTDSSKLASLGWKYCTELSEGIEKMYSWYIQDVVR